MIGSVCKIYRAVEGVRKDTMLGQSVRTGASNRLEWTVRFRNVSADGRGEPYHGHFYYC